MRTRTQFLSSFLLSAVFCISAGDFSAFAAPAPNAPSTGVQKSTPAAYQISGPFCNENLAVFLIKGKDKVKGQVLTLEEALAQKQVIVEETSDVNLLRVQNRSEQYVFLQSGDIVRGGKQDRAIQYDMMLAPKSGKISLPVFCVEHGRWQKRGQEGASSFSRSENALAGKELKLAAKKYGDQGSVWNNVSTVQGKLSRRIGAPVSSDASPSSFELTMDNEKVKSSTKQHISKLAEIVKGQSDVIGYAFAVNGKINSADVYASNALFQKLWPKLLKSTAAEAVAEADGKTNGSNAKLTSPKIEEVQKFLADAETKPSVRKTDSRDSEMTEQESSSSLLYQTKWYSAPREYKILDDQPVIHKNYIKK